MSSRHPAGRSEPVEVLRPAQRTAAYVLVEDDDGGVLMVRGSARSDLPGRWSLPGGWLRHGEHPRTAALRGLAGQTGLRAEPAVPETATADVLDQPSRGVSMHSLRLVYRVRPADLRLADGTPLDVAARAASAVRDVPAAVEEVRFVGPGDGEAGPALLPFVARLLGRPEPDPVRPESPREPEALGVAPMTEPRTVDPATGPADRPVPEILAPVRPGVPGADEPEAGPADGEEPVAKVQRPAAYALLVDERPPGGPRILLTRLAPGHSRSERELWTLPGGGIDHGEHPLAALTREVYEETGLPYTPGPLLDISSRHFVGRSPAGRLEDFHALRLVYTGSVPTDVEPGVVEVGGSSDLAAWFDLAELDRIATVPSVRESLAARARRQTA